VSRKKAGKLKKMTHKDRLAKAVRNEKRKRVSAAVRWEKAHVKRDTVLTGFKNQPSKARLRRQAMTRAVAEALSELPAVEEVRHDQVRR
jgi:formylmethanofuran dehydrogenase subunit E-like metal-binding protein